MTPCDNETVANVDDFPVVDLECSQPLSNGASAFVGENSEKRACILEATSIDTEDVKDLSCSQFWQHTCKDITAYRYVQKGNTSFGFICPLQRALWEENVNAGLKFFTLWTMQPWSLYWKKDVPDFINETVKSKTWSTTFGLSPKLSDATSNPTIQALIRAYDESGNKEKAAETRKRAAGLKAKTFIGNSVKNSRISLTGEFTSDQFRHWTDAAKSIGCLTSYADEWRPLLSIVAMDYPYR